MPTRLPGRSNLRIETLTGPALAVCLPDVARLRIDVFRAWPYLYDGSFDYEQNYLADFAAAQNAIVVAAFDGDRVVGAATGAPLGGHTAEFVPLFESHGYDPSSIFYCGESVLLPQYRGSGVGHIFFDQREAHARNCTGPNGAFTQLAFCSVVRSPDDPRRPADYVPLDTFWRKRGYAPVPGLVGSYSWRELGAEVEVRGPGAHEEQRGPGAEVRQRGPGAAVRVRGPGADEESKKPMQFWMRALTP